MVMMATEHYAAYRWVQAAIAALSLWLWLIASPFTLGYSRPAAYANDSLVGAQRAPVIALAFVSVLVVRYTAGYQLGYIASARDLLFGDGTERVLTSGHHGMSMPEPISLPSTL